MNSEVKRRLGFVLGLVKTAFHWGFIPLVLYLGEFLNSRAQDHHWDNDTIRTVVNCHALVFRPWGRDHTLIFVSLIFQASAKERNRECQPSVWPGNPNSRTIGSTNYVTLFVYVSVSSGNEHPTRALTSRWRKTGISKLERGGTLFAHRHSQKIFAECRSLGLDWTMAMGDQVLHRKFPY